MGKLNKKRCSFLLYMLVLFIFCFQCKAKDLNRHNFIKKREKMIKTQIEARGIKNILEKQKEERTAVWIVNEDDVLTAKQWYQGFMEEPSRVWSEAQKGRMEREIFAFGDSEEEEEVMGFTMGKKGTAFITLGFIIVCIAIFFLEEAQQDVGRTKLYSTISKQMMYDFPAHPIRYWPGVYKLSLQRVYHGVDVLSPYEGPIFEKIGQGEYWRIFTPILLHVGIVHLLFNMMWIYVLGKQMEQRLGIFRYLLFVAFTAAISNTSQYLMGGFSFVGISGVVCGMLMFILVRQNKAGWEGYQVQKSTMSFLMMMVLGMAGIQAISYLAIILGGSFINIPIANTAHIMGGVAGGLLAMPSRLFAAK